MYLVIACARCRRALVAESGRRQAACPSCGRAVVLADVRAFLSTDALDAAREAAGRLNARLAGREHEFAAAFVPEAPPAVRHDDRFQAAAAAARRAMSEREKADAVARALGEFGEEDLARAFEDADLRSGKIGAHLARMVATEVVFEPRPGLYRAL